MFSKAKDTDNQQTQGSSSPQARRMVKSAPSIISNDMTVHGSLVASGDIQVDGKVEGDIESGSLTIGEKATVHGEVKCEDVIIRGRVIGSVRASRVHLAGSAHVEGDIFHQALAVETGAFFEGSCRHSDNPMAEGGGRRRKSAAAKNIAPDHSDEQRAPAVASTRKGSASAPPKSAPRTRASRGRAPVEAQSALSRLTGGSNRKAQD
jgi:cytoskeletal protein CcmA (bactofilin family)